jgi:hypothetical protein
MNKQVLTLGIILSLGSVGCAGLGSSQSSTLPAQVRSEQGLDQLWFAAPRPASEGLETPRYADQGLGTLWGDGAALPEPLGVQGSREEVNGGDLWNPASVVRSWETRQGADSQPPRGPLRSGRSVLRIWY